MERPVESKSDAELLREYWAAQAQFGPFEVLPEEHLRMCRQGERQPIDLDAEWLALYQLCR